MGRWQHNATLTKEQMPIYGAFLTTECQIWHSIDGIATKSIYPNLARQNALYPSNALKIDRNKSRGANLAKMMMPCRNIKGS